jgi:hypothetical protein
MASSRAMCASPPATARSSPRAWRRGRRRAAVPPFFLRQRVSRHGRHTPAAGSSVRGSISCWRERSWGNRPANTNAVCRRRSRTRRTSRTAVDPRYALCHAVAVSCRDRAAQRLPGLAARQLRAVDAGALRANSTARTTPSPSASAGRRRLRRRDRVRHAWPARVLRLRKETRATARSASRRGLTTV